MKTRKIRKIIGISLIFILLIIVIYIGYVLLSYNRIEDNVTLDVTSRGNVLSDPVLFDKEYSITTYNIGFGAYSDDYSFFMDGGRYSRAYNKQAVLDNVMGSIEVLKEEQSDFLLLQEVDIKSTRSYGVDQRRMFLDVFHNSSASFAVNYNSAYLMYPILSPHGKSKSGLLTISSYNMIDSIRRSLPIDTSLYKLVDLDRCYTISRILVEDGRYLCLYNVHLSAYTKDESIVKNQMAMLSEDLKRDYDAGNYIICGGDFNQDLLGNSPLIFNTPELDESWAKAFQEDLLPEGFSLAYKQLSDKEIKELVPSCRNADEAYNKETTFVTMVDGFIISDNVILNSIEVIDNGFLYSDHNPVSMKFSLRERD